MSDALAGPSLNSLATSHGRAAVVRWVSEEVEAVNKLCGNAMSGEVVSYCAELIIDRFRFRTANALRIALRDGLNSGKIFGKLTYPLIAEWLTEHEAKVEEASYQKHQGTK